MSNFINQTEDLLVAGNEIVSSFGITFQYITKFTKVEKHLSDQSRKAMFVLKINIEALF